MASSEFVQRFEARGCDSLNIVNPAEDGLGEIEYALIAIGYPVDCHSGITEADTVNSLILLDYETRPLQEIARDDQVKLSSGDPVQVQNISSGSAQLSRQLIGKCWNEIHGFNQFNLKHVKPWIDECGDDWQVITGIPIDADRPDKLLKSAFERYGIQVKKRMLKTGRHLYSVTKTQTNDISLEKIKRGIDEQTNILQEGLE